MPQTILIVDDERRMVSLLQSYLQQEGYRVVTAYNGREALSVAQTENPDLVVLDIMMPEMNGIDFMQAHRAQPQHLLYYYHIFLLHEPQA